MEYSRESSLKWILVYLLIGLVAYGAVYYFFFYPSTSLRAGKNEEQNSQTQPQVQNNETAGWKTYANEKLGFTFQHPSDFYLQDSDIAPNILGGENTGGTLGVRKFTDINKELSELDKIISDVSSTKNVLKTQIKVDGFNAQEISYQDAYLKPMSGGPFWEIRIYVPEKSTNIFVQTNSEESLDVWRKVISTFKFTQPHEDKYSATACELPKTLAIDGLTYDDARVKILAAGWKPLQTRTDASGVWGSGPTFWQRGYYELQDCSGTGVGYCALLFQDSCNNYLHITTAGEEYGGYHATVQAAVVNKNKD